MKFAGREGMCSEFGEHKEMNLDISCTFQNKTDLEALRYLLSKCETLLYRDSRGRRAFITIDRIKVQDRFRPEMYTASFSPNLVSYIEEV
jgi:hypothetical protein